MQLLNEPLLGGWRQTVEAGIVAQHPFLLIDRNALMLIQPVAEMPRRSGAGIGSAGTDSAGIGRMTECGTLRTWICGVAGSRTHSTVRLLIGPLLILVRSLLILNLRLLVLVRSLLILVLPLLILVRSLLILVLPLLTLVLPLLVLVLALGVLVAALLILALAGRVLLLARARLVLAEARPHGWEGTEISSTLRIESGCGQAEKQDRGGGRGRRTHSFRVPGPVHKSFSRL
jgi:hypothetical protein